MAVQGKEMKTFPLYFTGTDTAIKTADMVDVITSGKRALFIINALRLLHNPNSDNRTT